MSNGFCQCGCGQEVRAPGRRFLRGHSFRVLPPKSCTPLEKCYTVDPESGCWHWALSITPRGYGQARRDGHQSAHRWVYSLLRGPIPEGMQLDHLCRCKDCVNPDHLEPVTPGENTRRGRDNLLFAPAQVRQMRQMFSDGVTQREIARTFGVDYRIVFKVVHRQSWKDIPDLELAS